MNLFGLVEFLNDYPEMSIKPLHGGDITLKGKFKFIASFNGHPSIEDSYSLELVISKEFPYELPKVYELEGKIPRDNKHHINPDGTLCLGSPLRVLMQLYDEPTLNTFAENCLVPYLYSVSHKLHYSGPFIFGELEHGIQGVLDDYLDIFGLDSPKQVLDVLFLLGVRERTAHRQPCPCNCGRLLRKCEFRFKINSFRNIAPRTYYRSQYESLKSYKFKNSQKS
ncbi:hypothetical protein [Bacillus subtilis]|uniref:hypothetical protein n=1 Tax=Bacillus subtilis TaxID=1423 RepID=UPI003978A9A9